MSKILNSINEAIGDTKMVHLSRIAKHYGVTGNIYGKLEYLNPGFSKKDRIGLQMIEEAEAAGLLKKGQHVVELTSGNTGTGLAIVCAANLFGSSDVEPSPTKSTGLAIVCAAKGYQFVACMSKGNSPERARMMRALGAEVVLVDQLPESEKGKVSGADLALVEEVARKITAERGAFRADQFNLISASNAHKLYTAEEMWDQCDGDIDAFVEFVGSGSTFQGCALGLKSHNKEIRCYLVEPKNAAFYAGGVITDGSHKIQGGGYSMDLPLIDKSLIDGLIQITDDEAAETTRNLAEYEGIFAGYSSGANVCAALKLLKDKEYGKNIVLLINDSGLKYLSTDLY